MAPGGASSTSDLTSASHREELARLVAEAGLELRPAALELVLSLLALGATPSAVANVLRTLSNQSRAAPTPGATPVRRPQ